MEAAVEDQPRCVFGSHVPVDWHIQQTAEGDGGNLRLNNKNTRIPLKNCSNKKHGNKTQKAGVETPKQKHVESPIHELVDP